MLFSFLFSLLISFLTGFVLQFISPPVNLHYIHWFCYVPLLLLLDSRSIRENFFIGYFCGIVSVFFIFYWLAETISIFSNLNWFLSHLILFAYSSFYGLLYGLVTVFVVPLKKNFPRFWFFLVPALWVSLEFLSPNIFPYYQGVSQYRVRVVWQLASVFGVYGLTYLVILSNCILADIIERLRHRTASPLFSYLVVIIIFLGTFVYGVMRYENIERALSRAPLLNVGLVQRHEIMQERMKYSRQKIIKLFKKETNEIIDKDIDLVIWPENGGLFNPFGDEKKEYFSDLLQSSGTFLLSGGDRREILIGGSKNKLEWNTSYLINPNGEVVDYYDKMVLLPFGEYIPKSLSFLNKYVSGPLDLEKGEKVTLYHIGSYEFTTPICYEAIIEKQLQKMAKGDLLINLTDDGWFGKSGALHQHAMMAAVGVTEYGLPLVRSTFNGINMVVEPHGTIRYESTPFVDKADVVSVRMAKFDTIYEKWGYCFPYFCFLISIVVIIFSISLRSG